jgi:hypothetical protein
MHIEKRRDVPGRLSLGGSSGVGGGIRPVVEFSWQTHSDAFAFVKSDDQFEIAYRISLP